MEKPTSKDGLSRRQLAALSLAAGTVLATTTTPSEARTRKSAPLSAEDRIAIEDLFSRYVWAYDCGDLDEFLALFTPDALVVGRGTLYRDRDAIAGWFRYLIDMRDKEGDDIWMHEAGQFRVVGGAPSCIVYAYATHFNGSFAKNTRGVRSLGYFVCECVKVKDEWKFRRFSITTWDKALLPWKKPLPWEEAKT